NFKVTTAHSGTAAVSQVMENPDVLLLLDFKLLDMTGGEVIDRLKEKGVEVPFLIMTGNGDERIAVEMMKLGARDYLVKDKGFLDLLPQNMDQVLNRVMTERRLTLMEMALRESETRFRMLFNSGTDAILVNEIEAGKPLFFVEANDIACQRLGYSREELFRMIPADIENPGDDVEAEAVAEILLNRKHVLYETLHTTKSGKTIPVETNSHLITLGEKPAVLSISRDVTERKQLEEQLRQAHKMEAIGKLAGGVAHDFNNLLTAIMGYSELMLVKMEKDNPFREGAKEIKKAGERAASLTQQLLAFSRKQMLQPKMLDLNGVVHGIEKMLKRIIGENITLISELGPDILNIKADPGQVEQIILNLSVNSSDAMPQSGALTIKTGNKFIDEHYCNLVPESKPGRFVCLSITDNGQGMDNDTLQHIFEPFFTTRKVGTGLGLSVVYGIVKQHNGWINVYSELGKGTTFNVYFPAVVSEAGVEPEEHLSLSDLQGNMEKILFVEDEEGVRKITVKALRDYGYSVAEAVTARQALDIFKKDKDGFSLVFSDIVLADKTGIELVEELQEIEPGVKVMLTSGYADKKSRWSDVNEKGFPFLQKPYSLAELLKSVREVLV
ncbi:MAG: response regulator, partial [bacterium]|nr:response regulator [bacterium]